MVSFELEFTETISLRRLRRPGRGGPPLGEEDGDALGEFSGRKPYHSAACGMAAAARRGAPTRSLRSASENAPPSAITRAPIQISVTSGL